MADVPELLERYRRGCDLITAALAGVDDAEVDFRPEPKAWCVRQIAAHIADSEVVAGWRFRRLIADPNPTLEAFDEKLWALNLGYDWRAPQTSLESFVRLREENHGLLTRLGPDAFERAGTHVERGRVTLCDMIRINVEHAESHARQIERVRAAFQARTSE
jgi:hypothetical protein